jgi:hypothetical protein
MKTDKKIVSVKLKKARMEKITDEEFPPVRGIQKQSALPKNTNKRKSHKAIQ